ncbi:rhamnogalacturonan acetylesterase [Novosphingobium flavum]|uniref:Rhamnogalacturonan acetylesterase n=1 Tax=Novosphingobium flavum TaxID=1778672 RepID=A0A7X1FUE7_9SPHN|nr:rhamnogalacturonan acetylesterase [Novosphingobium flavum]MBC2667189.1 rhamnogalacturonan acetylesterase [Novosphingobium flavum]
MSLKWALALVLAGPVAAQPAAPPASGRILIAGDSTAQTYGPERYPQSGWGQYLGCALVPGAQVINRAIAARSTRTFIGEHRWDDLMVETRPGDTILIQFGHNDAAYEKPERFAAATTMFRDNLLRFVWEARGRQAVPVLVTPVARRSFWDDGKARADFPEYSAVTRAVAAQTGTPLVDLEAASRTLIDRTGREPARALYLHYPPGVWPGFPKGIDDDTHFSEIGARRMAGLIADALSALPIPASALVAKERPDLARAAPLGTGACH